jgi:hypothetical protein
MRPPFAIRKDHFAGLRVFGLSCERQIGLVAGSPANMQIAADMGQIEDGDRDREGERGGVAEVNQRMDRRQAAFLPEASEQGFRSRAILRRLQPHPGKGPAPGLDCRQVAFRRRFQAVIRDRLETVNMVLDRNVAAYAADEKRTGAQLREVAPDIVCVLEVHEEPSKWMHLFSFKPLRRKGCVRSFGWQ